MKKTRILALILAVIMVAAMFTACGGTEDPAETTAATTTAATTTAATTTEATTTEATTTKDPGYNGYEFVLANPGDAYKQDPANEIEQEMMDIYAELEDELNCTFSFINVDSPETELLTKAMAGDNIADFLRCKQNAWVPGAVSNALRPLNTSEVYETGMNVNDVTMFDSVYTQLANIHDGNIWGCEMAGKYYIPAIGFTYVFNKPLLEQNGYPADTVYQKVRDYEWTWEYFMEIASTVTKDTDGDGQYDIFGQTMVDIESELESNGIGLMYFKEDTQQWTSGFETQNIVDSLTFVLTIATDPKYSIVDDIDNGTRRQIFYEGKAAFGCLYGAHYGSEGANALCEFDYGIVPIPKGPAADGYSYVIPDLNVFVLQNANKNWETSCAIMAKLASRFTDPAAASEYLRSYFRDDESIEVLENYCFPGARIQATRFSPKIKETLDASVGLIVQVGPSAAVETIHAAMQDAIADLFGY